MIPLAIVLGAYLLGGVPFGYLLVRLTTGRDVRSMGSGNIGATNVLRTTGRGLGILTLLLDIAKGYFAVWAAGQLSGQDPLWMSAAALAVLFGHAYPALLKFQGGKAVASFVGAFLCLTPVALAATLVIFVVTVAWSRFISLGSILCACLFPLVVWLLVHPPLPVLAAATIASTLVVWRHKSNIARLRAGTENVFSFGGRKS
jgi:acyl phosphate:glycerol-3-phosphate acyltransferase